MNDPSTTNKSNISAVTARLFNLILKMPVEDRQELLDRLEARESASKRQYTRKEYFMSVQYVVNERLYDGFIKNISPSGLFIEVSQDVGRDIVTGDPIILTFKHPDTREQLKLTGDVVRVDAAGIGVSFHQLLTTFLER